MANANVNAKLHDTSGKGKGESPLPAGIFGCEVNEHLLYEAVRSFLASQRSGTAHARDRSEVDYSTAKLFRQKGTGRARMGSAKSPLRPGGGTIFPPQNRNHGYRLPQKARRRALFSALSDRAAEDAILLVEDLTMEEPKTKAMREIFRNMGIDGDKVLLVLDSYDENVAKSARNLRDIDILVGRELNAYQVLWADKVVMTVSALKQVEEVFGAVDVLKADQPVAETDQTGEDE